MDETQLQRIKQRYNVVGNCDGLNRALEIALKIAPVDLSVLIMGENGVGKEVFPRIIHENSLRKNKKYFAVNCGAIPEGTIDSELFGHEKGAFTGAVERREGYFSVANGGTLFLDEVGELPVQTQARLLRVLETGEYIPVGSSEVKKTDVRIVAATNVNMEKAIAEGKFREDLFYRLNSVSISIPALRERGADAVLLFRKFALEMSEKYQMPPVRLDNAARQVIASYPWPGNVRQLKNIAENISVTSEVREISPGILKMYLPEIHRHDQLVTVDKPQREHSFENEREILYQILFDLRRDVTELKKLVNSGNAPATAPVPEVQTGKGNVTLMQASSAYRRTAARREEESPILEAEEIKENDAAPHADTRTKTLAESERAMIENSLAANNLHRKKAAQQLGISERTLYRKIKEYGLE